MFLDLKKRLAKLITKPSTAPTTKEMVISSNGLTIMAYTEIEPPAKAVAIWNKIAKRIKAAASSNATTGNKVSTNGPCARYCLITIKVAAGAVALAIADNVNANSKETY